MLPLFCAGQGAAAGARSDCIAAALMQALSKMAGTIDA